MKILFLTLYPQIMPSSRYRVYQFLPYLKSQGIDFDVYPVLPARIFRYLYNTKNTVGNLAYVISEIINRTYQLLQARNYDTIFIQKGLTSINLRGLPGLLKKKNCIFDIDDNVFKYPISEFSLGFLRKLQDKNQAVHLAQISRSLITGNKFLQDLGYQYNQNVNLVPTSVDTDRFVPKYNNLKISKKIIIGWIGSPSTSSYLHLLSDVFKRLSKKYQIKIKIIGDIDFKMQGLDLKCEPWSYETEVSQLQEIDIGIMPLADNDWTRGKCGLKALQYMAVGIPAVCSEVGANLEIIQDGLNGFLARNKEDWFDKLSLLIEDADLRNRLGQSGRETVERDYSINVNALKLKQIIEKVLN